VVDGDRLRIWTARLAAPAAFFLAAFVLVALVQRALEAEGSGSDGVPTTNTAPPTTGPTTPTTTGRDRPRNRRFYRVRPGDTLDSIAARFDTTSERLSELNPGIDPLALTPGQRIRVA
jgi:hypothetical protein